MMKYHGGRFKYASVPSLLIKRQVRALHQFFTIPCVLAFMLLPASTFAADSWPCQVTSVYDGDTFTCLRLIDKYPPLYKEERVRIAHINTPEIRGEGKIEGIIVKSYVEELLLEKTVTLTHLKIGKYGRLIARVYLDDVYINEKILREAFSEVPAYDKSKEANRLRSLDTDK